MVDRAGLENRYTRKGIEGSNPSLSASQAMVHSGHIGNGMFRRDRLHFRPEQVIDSLWYAGLEITVSEVTLHERHEPDAGLWFGACFRLARLATFLDDFRNAFIRCRSAWDLCAKPDRLGFPGRVLHRRTLDIVADFF